MNAAHWRKALGVSVLLGVPPEQFWRLSIIEWRAMLSGASAPAAAMRREELKILMDQFPDQRESADGGI